MLKITKISAIALIFYILFYLQIWGDNHIILYGTAIITVISMITYCFQQGHLDISNVPFGIWNNMIMVVYSLITGFFSINNSAIISSCLSYAAFSIVCVAICYASSEEGSFEWVLKVLIALAFISAVYALFRGAYWEGYGRTLSLANNPHSFAIVMNLGIFSSAFLKRNQESVFSPFSALLILFFFYSIIECGSRKFLIASSCLVIIWLIASFKDVWIKSNNQKRVIWVVLSVLSLLLVTYLFRSVYSQSDLFFRMQELDNSGNQMRIKMYVKAWDIFLEYPIFGGGYDQYKYLSGIGAYSHSTYAEAIADFGFVGCVIYFLPIIYTSYQILKKALSTERNYATLLLAALCIDELFLGVGQIFFMEFSHFLIWMVLFYYSNEEKTREKPSYYHCKYIRAV